GAGRDRAATGRRAISQLAFGLGLTGEVTAANSGEMTIVSLRSGELRMINEELRIKNDEVTHQPRLFDLQIARLQFSILNSSFRACGMTHTACAPPLRRKLYAE